MTVLFQGARYLTGPDGAYLLTETGALILVPGYGDTEAERPVDPGAWLRGASADDYLAQLLSLLPQGGAWPRDPGSVLYRLLSGFAPALARFHARIIALWDEIDPRSAGAFLIDYERVTGLPDPCLAGGLDSDATRRQVVYARWAGSLTPTKANITALAADLGYTVQLTEHRAARCSMACIDQLSGLDWGFAFTVRSGETTVRVFDCTGTCIDPLRSWGNALLECAVNRVKPAHTVALFAYGDA